MNCPLHIGKWRTSLINVDKIGPKILCLVCILRNRSDVSLPQPMIWRPSFSRLRTVTGRTCGVATQTNLYDSVFVNNELHDDDGVYTLL